MNIRKASNSDSNEIISLITSVYDEYGEIMFTEGADKDLLDINQNYHERGGDFVVMIDQEKKIVLDFIQTNFNDTSLSERILREAEKLEADSNQLLNFTKIIKESDKEQKKDIIEQLWKILISDNNVDQYESNLMRRICGLIYFSDKENGEIKMKVMKSK